jgi:hypothetical protein
MTSVTQNSMTVRIALLLPCAASLWLLARSNAAAPATYAVVGTFLLATALIAVNAWKNSQPTDRVGQLIHEVDTAPSLTANALPVAAPTSEERWAAWHARGEKLDASGRVRALLALSIAVTAAFLYVWRT